MDYLDLASITNIVIELKNPSIEHDGHLASIAAIPQIIENSIYIDSVKNENNDKHPEVEKYDYYVSGLKIGNVDYTVKAVVAQSKNVERYYDHKLTKIEKGKLLSTLPVIHKSGEKNNLPLDSIGKDRRLFSLLQISDKENAKLLNNPLVGKGVLIISGDMKLRIIVVVEKEQKNSPDDMETINIWAELSTATDAQSKTAPDTHALNAILSRSYIAKIIKNQKNELQSKQRYHSADVRK